MALNEWLSDEGARLLHYSYSEEGGVETLRWEFTVRGEKLTVFADTEAGLSVCGSAQQLLGSAALMIRKAAEGGRARCAAA